MSSADDTTSSTVSAPTASPDTVPEEFPVRPHQEAKNEQVSSPEGSGPIELNTSSGPPDPTYAEPNEHADIPLKTKPLPKVNAVAREIRVRVTGARAGSASGAGERELFSESTATVLVFEKGGVIGLTAAVTPGQLLFLTNEESKREVVAQVIRKRAHRPTGCFAELEFTEPASGFWGIEFSAATPLLPKDSKEIEAFELVASAEMTADELEGAVPAANAEEVQVLRKEVEALRSQLDRLQAGTEPGANESTGAIRGVPAVPSEDTREPLAEAVSYQTEKVQWAELAADVSPTQSEPRPSHKSVPRQNLPPQPAPDFHIPVPRPKRSFRARGQFTPGFRTAMFRLAILSCVLAALIDVAWYKHWFPWMHKQTKFSVATWAGGVTTKVAMPEATTPSPVSAAETSSGNAPGVTVEETPPHLGLSSKSPGGRAVRNEKRITATAPIEAIDKPPVRERNKRPGSTAMGSPVRSSTTKESTAKAVAPVPTVPSSTVLPPKLIKSERAVASLEDLRDFETGSVVIDAIIGTAGNVTSPTVLSGPPSLREPALEALKYYRYEPARQNGRPVPAHVSIKIQFHFE